jgi:hypothetical protein
MPHVILSGPTAPEDIWLAFQPLEFVEGQNRFKADAVFLTPDRSELLVRSLVVERGFRRNFYVRIHRREDGCLHIGLDVMHQPDKSDAVRRLIGLYAWQICQVEPAMTVSATNIGDQIREPQ